MWPGVEDGRDLLLIWRGVWAEEERLHTVTLIHSQGRARLLTLIGQRLLAAALSLARTGLDSPSVGLAAQACHYPVQILLETSLTSSEDEN